jgi:hypothetical protein
MCAPSDSRSSARLILIESGPVVCRGYAPSTYRPDVFARVCSIIGLPIRRRTPRQAGANLRKHADASLLTPVYLVSSGARAAAMPGTVYQLAP